MTHALFEPFKLKSLDLKNRIVMAPMTRCRAGWGDVPTPLMATYYAQRATAGLIITEGTPVSAMARGYLWTPGIYNEEQVEGWRQICRAVAEANGQIFMQIWHVGRISNASILPENAAPLGPTDQLSANTQCFAYDADGNPGNVPTSQPQAMTEQDCQEVIDEFVQAAQNAIAAGMQGVEIHGANGYLFDQFLNSQINSRDDQYGGSIENRCRLLLETVDAVCDEIGADHVGVRLSPNGRFNDIPDDPEMTGTFVHLSAELNKRNLAYLHLNDQTTFGFEAIPEDLLRKIREQFRGTLIVCGGYDADKAMAAIDAGMADLVAFGNAYIANPDLPDRLLNQWPLNEANAETFYGGGREGYTDYTYYKK